jgi:hypothetical protein
MTAPGTNSPRNQLSTGNAEVGAVSTPSASGRASEPIDRATRARQRRRASNRETRCGASIGCGLEASPVTIALVGTVTGSLAIPLEHRDRALRPTAARLSCTNASARPPPGRFLATYEARGMRVVTPQAWPPEWSSLNVGHSARACVRAIRVLTQGSGIEGG